jgi:hypothetical protein
LLILVVSFWEGGQEEGCVGVRKAPWWVLVRRRVDECGNLAEGPVWRGHGGGGGGDARGKGLTAAENSGPVFWGLVVGASGVVLRSRALVEMKLGLWSTVRECVTESEGAWRCVGAGTVGETRPSGVFGVLQRVSRRGCCVVVSHLVEVTPSRDRFSHPLMAEMGLRYEKRLCIPRDFLFASMQEATMNVEKSVV